MTLPGKLFRPWDGPAMAQIGSGVSHKDKGLQEDAKPHYSSLISTSPLIKLKQYTPENFSPKVEITNATNLNKKSLTIGTTDNTNLQQRESKTCYNSKLIESSPLMYYYNQCHSTHARSVLSGLPSQPQTDCFEIRDQSSSVSNNCEPISPSNSDYYLSSDSTSNAFLYPVAINELANLSRNELTAIGLLPPELPSSHKAKRQRPKRFRCPHCQVGFSNNGQLRGHIRIHTGERPFVCEQEDCRKSFTRNEELTRHRRIHTGLRPFPCSFCGKKFGRKDHLKKHTRTHQRIMYTPVSMIGYGNPFQPFRPPILSTTVSADHSLSSVPPHTFPLLSIQSQSHFSAV